MWYIAVFNWRLPLLDFLNLSFLPAYSDKDFEELKKAFNREKEFLSRKIAYERKLPFGEKKLPASLIKESAELILQTLQEAKTQEELNRLIRKRFTIYQAAGEKGEGKVLFTGYYSPVYEGSLKNMAPLGILCIRKQRI